MAKPRSPRPLSIKVIAILHIVWTVLAIPTLGKGVTPTRGIIVLGFHIVSGWLAFSRTLFFDVLLNLCLAVGLWRLNETGRRVAIGFSVYAILNGVLRVINPSTRAIDIEQLMSQTGISYSFATFTLLVIWIMSAIQDTFIIWFLIKRKSAFVKATK